MKSSVVGSEGERGVAMRPGVVPLAVGGGVDGRRGVAVERAGRADDGGGCGGGCARRGGCHGAGGGRAGGRRQGQLVVTSRHAVEHLGQVGRALQDRLLQTRHDTIRDAIITCAQKRTRVSLIYRTETTTKKRKTELKSVQYVNMQRTNCKDSESL